MSDFHQRGLISTLPRLTDRPLEDIEDQLGDLARNTPVALILPCTLDDLRRPAMQQILRETAHARYFSRVVIPVNRAIATDLPEMKKLTSNDPRVDLLWNDEPAWQERFPGSGKGHNLWTALGWLLSQTDCQVVVTHDTDILNYRRELPALLTLPLLDPALGYRFIKGYYPRLSDKQGGQLFGRVTRLFVGPLLRALVRVEGHYPLLDFLDSFRYPLAGEFGGRLADLAQLPIPSGWGLEIDLLCSVHRSIAPDAVAQIDLGSNYEHKHQMLNPGQSQTGLTRLASEILACLLHQLAREGITVDAGFLSALRQAYAQTASDTLRRYRHVALLNQLDFSEKDEAGLVESFLALLTNPGVAHEAPLPAWSELRRGQGENFPVVSRSHATEC